MGIFNRFREDVQRVGAELAPMIGGTLEGPGSDGITWQIAGTRGGRRVRIELNHMHGIFGLACEIGTLGLASFELRDDKNALAAPGRGVGAARPARAAPPTRRDADDPARPRSAARDRARARAVLGR
jgi:hypothetical protein